VIGCRAAVWDALAVVAERVARLANRSSGETLASARAKFNAGGHQRRAADGTVVWRLRTKPLRTPVHARYSDAHPDKPGVL
jgi:hypothetical protein